MKDSAGYDLDPDVVAALATWFENIGKQCGKDTDQITLENLGEWPHAKVEFIGIAGLLAPAEAGVSA
jgi:hypothetical protein